MKTTAPGDLKRPWRLVHSDHRGPASIQPDLRSERSTLFFLLIIAVAIVVGYLGGGRLSNLSRLRLRHLWLLFASLLGQTLIGLELWLDLIPQVGHSARIPFVIGSYLIAAIWIGMNIPGRTRAMQAALVTVLAGWLLLFLPIAVNGGMPVSAEAMRATGRTIDTDWGYRVKQIPETDSRLIFLGDTIVLPIVNEIFALGDFVLLIGISAMLILGMKSEQGPHEAGPVDYNLSERSAADDRSTG